MALVLADRVKETTTTTGTGTVTLLGASTGFQSFAAVGNGNTTYYTIAGQTTSEWEVGIGTYTSAGTTLSRDTVLASSNAGSLVTFSAGTKDVFVTYPAGRSVYVNGAVLTATNSSVLPIASGGTNSTATPTNGGIGYGTGTAHAYSAAGTSGQVLTSAGAAAPTWTTATNANTASAIVQRDASGNFSAGTITATLSGNASSATNATFASSATNATFASSATNASAATNATYATSAGSATNASYATNAGQISSTNLGVTGSTGLTTVSSTTAWSNFPIGYSAMFLNGQTGTGAPTSNYFFFTKTANRDAGGGWGGIAFDYSGGDFYFGNTTVSTSYATWYKLAKADGSNASGTWGINVTGSAASATNATYASSAGSATNAVPISGGINMTGSFGLNDSRLYLRTNGDTNHYFWNADDDWEELIAYSGTGFRVKSSTGTTLMTFSTGAVNAGVALQEGGNQVLNAGNYAGYVATNSSTVNLVNFAIGTTIVVYLGSGSTGFAARSNRNATPTGAGYIVIAGNDTFNLGSSGSTALTGTWRARGYWAPFYSPTAYETYQIFTRTA